MTPLEFKTSLGEFSDYCPVDLALRGELVVCSGDSLQFAVEYRYYHFIQELKDCQTACTIHSAGMSDCMYYTHCTRMHVLLLYKKIYIEVAKVV